MRAFRKSIALRALVVGLATAGLVGFTLGSFHARADAPSFSADYVSKDLGGGEPFVMYSNSGHDLVYSGHEGTTHLYNGGGTPAPGDTCDIKDPGGPDGFVCSYDNHVNDWFSTDGGATWSRAIDNPAGTGFSDPSLTEDQGSTTVAPIDYNTGIDLVNDSLFATQDGGQHWIASNPQCHEGDRPWLAGGQSGEVFMGTDSSLTSHVVTRGSVTLDPVTHTALAISCSNTTIPDSAAASGTGIGGQLYYDHNLGQPGYGDLVEPARFSGGKLGISVLHDASHADFTSSTSTSSFTARADPNPTTYNDLLGPRIIIGTDDTIYEVWASNPTALGTNNCNGGTSASPLPNQVLMAYTKDEGVTWSATQVVAQMTNAVAWWPWIAAASDNISVVWYQSNQVTDPDCDSAHSVLGLPSTTWTVQEANIFGATTTATYPVAAIDAIPDFDTLHPGGVIHVGAICQNGTTCALNTTPGNEDRRLGDYFTNALDQNGCVLIATADTQLTDTITGGGFRTGRPLFAKQVSGPSLTTGQTCAALEVGVPEAPWTIVLAAAGTAAAAAILYARRRKGVILA